MLFVNNNARINDSECRKVIRELHIRIKSMDSTDSLKSHFTKYAAVICSGALERSFKSIIADYVTNGVSSQLKEYVDCKIKRAPTNPQYDAIVRILGEFDKDWSSKYKSKIATLSQRKKDALKSLVENRNSVAHGQSISASFLEIAHYYYHARDVIAMLETILI